MSSESKSTNTSVIVSSGFYAIALSACVIESVNTLRNKMLYSENFPNVLNIYLAVGISFPLIFPSPPENVMCFRKVTIKKKLSPPPSPRISL